MTIDTLCVIVRNTGHSLVLFISIGILGRRDFMCRRVGAISQAIDRKLRTCDSPRSFANKITYTVPCNRKQRSRLQTNAITYITLL